MLAIACTSTGTDAETCPVMSLPCTHTRGAQSSPPLPTKIKNEIKIQQIKTGTVVFYFLAHVRMCVCVRVHVCMYGPGPRRARTRTHTHTHCDSRTHTVTLGVCARVLRTQKNTDANIACIHLCAWMYLKSAFFSLSLSSREKGTTPVSPTAASSELVNAVILLSSIMALPAAGCHTHNNNHNHNRNHNHKQ